MRAITFRGISAGLVVVLALGTLVTLGLVTLTLVDQERERTRALIDQVNADLKQAHAERRHAVRLTERSLRLTTKRIRLAVLIENCTLERVQGKDPERCHSVRRRVHHLLQQIQHLEAAAPLTQPTTVTHTVTTAAPSSPSPPKHVGNSDECPPKNPGC